MSTPIEDRLLSVREAGAAHAADVDRDGRFPDEAVGALAREGLQGLTLPEAIGGLGGGPSDFLETVRAVASADASNQSAERR